MQKAFTLIELSLVLAVGTLIGVAGSIPVSKILTKIAVDTTSENILLAISDAKQNSINSKNSENWGICLVSNRVFVFSGSCDTTGRKRSYAVQGLSSVSGLNTTTFSKLYGEPNPSAGLSNVVVSGGGYTKVIAVGVSGGISVTVN